MAMPAAPVAGPPEAAGAILPTFMAPQGGGAIASMVSGLYGQSVDLFQDLTSCGKLVLGRMISATLLTHHP
jgi:hypothetical protein